MPPLTFSRPPPPTLLRPHRRPLLLCTAVPPAVDTLGLVLLPSTTSTRFDSGALSSPVVHRYLTDEGPNFVMWYTARPRFWPSTPLTPPGTTTGLVGLALSRDGLVWERVPGPQPGDSVLAPSDDWWTFDTVHLSLGTVSLGASARVRADAGVYLMYYAGGNREKLRVGDATVPGARMAVGVAVSKDGEHFTRIEGDHPSGAALQHGEHGAFDQLFVAGPCVTRLARNLSAGSAYVMHYFTFDYARRRFVIGQALSRDGLAFEKHGQAPVLTGEGERFAEGGVSRCSVVERAEGAFVMFVECIGADGVHRIALADSRDCLRWGRLTLVLEPGEGDAWDAKGVSHPNAVMLDGGRVRLYYVGRGAEVDADRGVGTGIGAAQSDGEDWTVLRRIQAGGE